MSAAQKMLEEFKNLQTPTMLDLELNNQKPEKKAAKKAPKEKSGLGELAQSLKREKKSQSIQVSLRVEQIFLEKIDKIAQESDRSRNYVVNFLLSKVLSD